jgi:hypothetical protein
VVTCRKRVDLESETELRLDVPQDISISIEVVHQSLCVRNDHLLADGEYFVGLAGEWNVRDQRAGDGTEEKLYIQQHQCGPFQLAVLLSQHHCSCTSVRIPLSCCERRLECTPSDAPAALWLGVVAGLTSVLLVVVLGRSVGTRAGRRLCIVMSTHMLYYRHCAPHPPRSHQTYVRPHPACLLCSEGCQR